MRQTITTAIALFLALGSLPQAYAAGEKIYFTDFSAIKRANLDGSSIESIFASGTNRGISFDIPNGKMYWLDASGAPAVKRANINGTSAEDLVTTGLSNPQGLALDLTNGKVYWADIGNGDIKRANLNGTSVETLITGVLSKPYGIALDVPNGKMYWADLQANKIQRSNLNGTSIENLVTTGLTDPFAIALDLTGGKMYWTDAGADRIQRANLAGTSVETLVSTGLSSPSGISLDLTNGKMYWSDGGTNKIQRANLDGTSVEDIITGLTSTSNLALYLPPDTTGPAATAFSPVDNAIDVSVTSNLVITFNETTRAGTGTLTIKRSSDDSTVETITVSGGLLSGNGSTQLTLNPVTTLSGSTSYYVLWGANAFKDTSNNPAAGVTSASTWNFTTADITAPTVSALSPADNETDVALITNLVITFDEATGNTGTGTVRIYKTSDDTLIETIAVTGSLITGSGTTIITIDPAATLVNSTEYYVQVSSNAFPDASRNFYAGISNNTGWRFTTVAAAVSSSSSSASSSNDDNDNGGGGGRGAGGNERVAEALQQRFDAPEHAAEHEFPGLGPVIDTPLGQMLSHVQERLTERIEERIAEKPSIASLLRRVLERMEKRIQRILLRHR